MNASLHAASRRLVPTLCLLAAASGVSTAPPLWAQVSSEELAKKLSNPVAALISVPFQFNWDDDFGPERNGRRFQLNFQPVVPMSLNPDWTVISRTIVPIVDQNIPLLGDGSQSGIGDITQSFFFSPAKPGPDGLIWGVGPVALIPTDTDHISAERWGLGPTAVVLKQDHGWTYGMLANHIWSVGGSSKPDISSTFLQPFVAHTTSDAWTFTLNTETTYDWESEQWTVPINFMVSKVFTVGSQPMSLGAGVRYWADSASGGPHGWGARIVFTLMFPR